MSLRVIVLDAAEEELAEAAAWYETQRPGLAQEFLTTVEEAIDRLTETPGIALPIRGVSPNMGRDVCS